MSKTLGVSNVSKESNISNGVNFYWNTHSSNDTPLSDVFKQCIANDSHPTCRSIFIGIATIQIIILIIGFSLNGVIICSFYRKPFLRKKNPNILLFNQAVADLVNVMIYVLPKLIHLLYQVCTNHMIVWFQKLNIAFLYLSVSSTVLLFGIISIERFLSIYLPLWHMIYVQKHHLWYAVLSVWFIVILIIAAIILTMFHESTSEGWKNFCSVGQIRLCIRCCGGFPNVYNHNHIFT